MVVNCFGTGATERPERRACVRCTRTEYFVRRYGEVRACLTQSWRDAQREQALAPGIEPEALASALIAVLDGLQLRVAAR